MGQLIEASIEIDAPIETVWATVNDLAVMVECIDWVHEAWWENNGPTGRGSVYAERAKPGIKESIYRWELTEWEPPCRAVHSHASREIEGDLEVLLEPITHGCTRYTQRMQIRALPAFRPLGWLLERTVMKRQMQRDFERMILPNFKQAAERAAAS